MTREKSTGRWPFWAVALLWLPAGVVATAAVRFLPRHGLPGAGGMAPAMLLMSVGSLMPVAVCGLPLALGCRRLWRLGYRRAARMAGTGLGAVTAALVAGLLGAPVWIAWYWLARRG